MTTKDYYRHARGLGAFTAEDCYRLAKEAAALDDAAAARKIPPPGAAHVETIEGVCPVTISFSIKVF